MVSVACSSGGGGEPTGAPDTETATPTAVPESPTPPPVALVEWGDEDCIFRPSGDLGELTRVIRTYVENEPKLNIERIFRMFRQSETESSILRCDMSTAGLFSTWWVQSFATEEEAKSLFESMVLVTASEVDELNSNPLACALIRASREGSDSYQWTSRTRGYARPTYSTGGAPWSTMVRLSLASTPSSTKSSSSLCLPTPRPW